MRAAVVKSNPATEEALINAFLVTRTGSRTPALIKSQNSSVRPL